MRVVTLYGPPGAGKLTVAEELQRLTGFKLFHNHLTVNPVHALFEFGSPEFIRALRSIRRELFTASAKAGIDLIFTANAARGHIASPTLEESIDEIEEIVHAHGGAVLRVHLEPSREVLEARLSNGSRVAHGKLTDVERLRRQMVGWNSRPLRSTDLSIDNTDVPAPEAARRIVEHYGL